MTCRSFVDTCWPAEPVDLNDPIATALRTAEALSRGGQRYALFGGLSISRIALLGGEDDTGLNVLDLVQPRSARYADRWRLILARSQT